MLKGKMNHPTIKYIQPSTNKKNKFRIAMSKYLSEDFNTSKIEVDDPWE